MAEAFIKLHRKMMDWEWYGDCNTFRLFIHCLLIANWKDGRFMGQAIPRGSFVSSYPQLAQQTNMSIQNVRTAINHLKSTGELTVKSHSKFSVFTVVNYCQYQNTNTQTNSQPTVSQQSTNSQLTTIEEYKNIRIKEKYTSSFDTFWKNYPRKQDKGQAYKCYLARLNDGYSEDQLLTACKNYAAECEKNKTEQRYIKHGSTFLSVNEPFLDYLKGENNGNVGRISDDDEEQRIRELDEHIRRVEAGEFDAEDEELRRMWD